MNNDRERLLNYAMLGEIFREEREEQPLRRIGRRSLQQVAIQLDACSICLRNAIDGLDTDPTSPEAPLRKALEKTKKEFQHQAELFNRVAAQKGK